MTDIGGRTGQAARELLQPPLVDARRVGEPDAVAAMERVCALHIGLATERGKKIAR